MPHHKLSYSLNFPLLPEQLDNEALLSAVEEAQSKFFDSPQVYSMLKCSSLPWVSELQFLCLELPEGDTGVSAAAVC